MGALIGFRWGIDPDKRGTLLVGTRDSKIQRAVRRSSYLQSLEQAITDH
ncbi:hypothetical protein QG37_00167 [Candidozyma auris]|nr:hypothetical protein QG37_00167 [[Candida] auris]